MESKDYIIQFDVAEVMAALRAATFSSDLEFDKVVLEGDALQIMQAPKHDGPNRSKYGYLIQDTQKILNGLKKWQVQHVSRKLNGAGHRLVK